jgi:hypothetical protein
MNLVGKIFTVVIFVMALVFMSFAVCVAITHDNWKLKCDNAKETAAHPLGLTQQLNLKKTENEKLKELHERVKQSLQFELAAKQQALAKLETANAELRDTQNKDEKTIKDLEGKCREALGEMKACQDQLANLRTDVVTLREDIAKAREARDKSFAEVVHLTDELHNAVNELTALKERSRTLAADLAEAKQALDYSGINVKIYRDKAPPHWFDGVVLAVPRPDVVEISGGSDMGLQKGHKLEIVRMGGGSNSYVGRIEIVQTSFDKAVGQIDPKTLKSPVQRGDRAYAQLK